MSTLNMSTNGGVQASCTLDQSNVSSSEVIHLGQEAWQRTRNNQSYQDWLAIGGALRLGRAEAMRDAHINRPVGHCYNACFAAWAKKFGFDAIDRGDRARLFEVLDNLPAIESWRAQLPEHQRLALNHPSAVLRRWRAATQASRKANRLSPHAQLKAAHAETLEQLHRAQREIAKGGGDLWTANDRPEDIADIMLVKLSASKAKRVAEAILKRLKDAQQAPAANAPLSLDMRH